MAKKNWISVCPTILKPDTTTSPITWESSSDEEAQPNKRGNISYSQFKSTGSSDYFSSECNQRGESQLSPLLKFGFSDLDLSRISPELTSKTVINNRPLSPIIMNFRYKRKMLKTRDEFRKSPDLFNSKSTQDIENLTPDLKKESPVKIEPFDSQFGSPVQQSEEEPNLFLYYQPPKRRKKHKKGTLAHQLQHVLRCKKSQVKIWHFEVQKNFETTCSTKDVIRFKFKKRWKEYGITLLECEQFNADETDKSRTVLVSLGASQVVNIDFEGDRTYELHMPYGKGDAMYKGCRIDYFFNVSKILKVIR